MEEQSDAGGATRLLVVADTWCQIDGLCDRVRAEMGSEQCEVMVVAPALTGRLHTLTDDTEDERSRTEARLENIISRLERHGVSAEGEVGDKDPVVAITDALARFPAEKIFLVTDTEPHQNWKEHRIREQTQQFDLPVRHVTVPHELAL
jgi:hypothetical protein